MAVTLSSAEKRAALDARLGSGTPTTWYAALVKTIPAVGATTLDEPVAAEYGGYTRVAFTNSATNLPAATGGGTKANGTDILFARSTGGASSPVSLGWVVLCDTASGAVANFYVAAIVGGAISIANNVTPRLSAGQLTFAIVDPA